MKTWKKLGIYVCAMMLTGAACAPAALAGGPPLRENVCNACHQDNNSIMPKKHPDVGMGAACMSCHTPNPAKNEPTKYSTNVHKAHQGQKTKIECSACHAL